MMLLTRSWSRLVAVQRASNIAPSASPCELPEGPGGWFLGLVLLQHTVSKWLGWLQWSHITPYAGQSVFLTFGGAFLPWPRLPQ